MNSVLRGVAGSSARCNAKRSATSCAEGIRSAGALAWSRVSRSPSHGGNSGSISRTGRGKEVPLAVPGRLFAPCVLGLCHQAQVRLMDQGRGLKRLARLLMGQFLRGQYAEVVVDERQELAGLARIAPRGAQDVGDVRHRRVLVRDDQKQTQQATPSRSSLPAADGAGSGSVPLWIGRPM